MLIKVVIQGVTPLLMNKFSEEMLDDKNRDKNATPRELATKTAYLTGDNKLYYPAMNVYAALIAAGKFHKSGRSAVTTQRGSLIPAGILMNAEILYFSKPNNNHFEVDSRSVVIPATGGRIMKHRAKLDVWELPFELEVDKNMFSEKEVRSFLDDAGSKIGLGDFRPSRKCFYGRFKIKHWVAK